MANPVQSVKTLLDRYNATAELAVAPGDNSRNFNAKNVGTEPGGAVDAINGNAVLSPDKESIQKDFKLKQQTLHTQFTEKGLNYSDLLKVNTTKYAPSGRL
jgi:hypothetical protein